MDDIATKKRKAGFLPRKFVGRINSLFISWKKKMIKTSSTTLLEQWEFCGIKIEHLVDPLKTETSERSNGPSSITKKVRTSFRRRCKSIALRLTSCLIPYGMGWS